MSATGQLSESGWEHGQSRISEGDLYRAYSRADEWLKDTQDAEDITRLRACAHVVTVRLSGAELGISKFSLRKATLAYEARFIEQALMIEQGSVSRAAKRLGMLHQTLLDILKRRHKNLLRLRTPAKRRLRSIIKKPQK
jgi:DNA-binding NtrC family response regulator